MTTIVLRLETTFTNGEKMYQEIQLDRSLYTPLKLTTLYTKLALDFDAYVKGHAA